MIGTNSFYLPEDEEHIHTSIDTSSISIPHTGVDGDLLNVGDGDFVVKKEGGVTKVESAVEITAPGTSASHLNVDGHVVQRDAQGGVHVSNLVVEAETPFTNASGWLPGLNFAQAATLGEISVPYF